MSSLFRKEALEHRKDRLFGEVILLQPFSMTVLVTTVLVVCSLVIAILFWGTYARKEKVKGVLVPDKGVVKIFAPQQQQGTISEVFVAEGDRVTEGQALVSILSERATDDGKDVDQELLQELDQRKKQSNERINTEESLSSKEQEKLASQIEGLELELKQIEESVETQNERLNLAKSRMSAAEILKKRNHMSVVDYEKTKEEFLTQKQQYQELIRLKSSKETALKQAKAELDQLPLRTQTRIQEIEGGISDLKQREVELKGRRKSQIRSPIAGQVTSLQAQQGQWQANIPLMTILPDQAYFQAELFVPSRAIGFIEIGQPVKIRYDAFPYQRYGIYQGKVTSVSKNVFHPQELGPIPIEVNEPVYRVIVTLDQQFVSAYAKQFKLQSGMSLEADIILDKQSLIDWMLDPLFSLKGKF